MRSVTLTGLVGLAFLMACHVEVGSSGGGGQPARAPARAQNKAAPAPAPAPPPPNRAAPTPAPAPSPAAPPQAGRPNNGMTQAYVGSETVNVALIKEIVAKSPKACGYIEV